MTREEFVNKHPNYIVPKTAIYVYYALDEKYAKHNIYIVEKDNYAYWFPILILNEQKEVLEIKNSEIKSSKFELENL